MTQEKLNKRVFDSKQHNTNLCFRNVLNIVVNTSKTACARTW